MLAKLYFLIYLPGILIVALVYLVKKSLTRLVSVKNRNGKDGSETALDDHRAMWTGRYQNIPLRFYGGGCDRNFDVYLQGESRVTVSDPDGIADWLLGCRYLSDLEHMGVRDHWQHPCEFEQSRTGDCEDYSLWAWRKLVELGYECEFMVGKWIRDGRAGTHAWVLLHDDENPVIFETTGVTKERMFKPLESAIAEYIPFASIDSRVRKKVYLGITAWFMKLRDQAV